MQDTKEIKNQIIDILKEKGPSLPVQISKQIGVDTLFSSVFLSELLSEKKIKTSYLRIGSTPLYFLPEQEQLLENFQEHIKNKEKEALLLLKQKKILNDSEQPPAIKVALRELKDFAIPIKKGEELYWKYFTEEETRISEKPQETQKKIPEKPITEETQKKINPEKENKPKTPNEKPEFIKETIKFLEEHNIKTIKETNIKKRDYESIIEINSDIGKIKFLLKSKDKKKISAEDIMSVIKSTKEKNLYALFLHTGELTKPAKEYSEEYKNILKIKKI